MDKLYSGFVANPSFEDGSPGAIAQYATLNDWKLGGDNSGDTGVSASIQTTNVHAGDGSNALEVTSVNTGGEWNIKVWSTTYPFDGDNSTPITVTVSFWAKTDDAAPGSEDGTGDMRLIVKDTGSSNLGNQTNRVLLTTGAWVYITKTFTFAAAADYSLSLYLEFGKLDGVTQIDGITSSVSGGAVMGDQSPVINLVGDNPQQLIRGHAYVELGATATDDTDDDTALTATIAIDASAVDTATAGSYSVTYDVSDAAGNAATQVTRTVTVEDGQTYSGFVVNPSFEDGSAGPIAGGTTLNDWKLEGSRRLADGVSASIQTNNVHAGDGSNALEVTSNSNSGSGNVWDIALVNTTYPFAGDNLTPVEVTVSFWAKTDDVNPISANTNGDMRVKVRDAVGSINKANVVLLTTGSWIYITKTFTFAPAANYSLSLYFEFGKVDGVTQIDGITSSVTGGATLASGITWNGSTDNDWNTATNWTPERVPTAADAYTIIPVGLTNYPTFGSAVDINSVTMANGSSLISTSTFSGSITYTRNLATTNWYLVSSPVSGQDIDTFVSAEGLASGSGNNNMGLAAYDNSSSAWSYYQSGASGSGDFALGSGRSIKLSTAGDISFTGTMPVDDVSIAITNGYNLVGNPYPSYIAANTAADSSNNILSVNTSILSEETLWFWNQATNTYDAINQAPSSMYIAPVQGFFVETSGSNTLSITEAMQSHQSSDSFQRLSNERPEISLVLSDGENTRGTDVYYIDGTTTGFDNGYDSTTFGGAANSFSIYTHLVANSNGQDLAIQSLPNSDLDTMIIPVGITAGAGEEISISANAINLPEGVNIYLEDKSDDSFTLLDSTSVFTTTPDEDLNGIGRFYIHTTATALSDNQVSLTNVSMYLVDRNLTITGVHSGDTNVRVYDLLGKEVHNTSFQGTGFNKITLPSLTTGVYVVQLKRKWKQ